MGIRSNEACFLSYEDPRFKFIYGFVAVCVSVCVGQESGKGGDEIRGMISMEEGDQYEGGGEAPRWLNNNKVK